LQVYTKAEQPQRWAQAQFDLGLALRLQGLESSGAEKGIRMSEAVEAFRAALQVYTKADLPRDFAATQNNLGNALRLQGVLGSPAEARTRMAEAVEAHRAALQVVTKADLPQAWAAIQDKLGDALTSQSDWSAGAEASSLLAAAVEAFHGALQVRTKADLPQDWAATQYDLGWALLYQSQRNGGPQATGMAQAVGAFRAALQVYTKVNEPLMWAVTEESLARALRKQGDWGGVVEAAEHALEIQPDDVDVLEIAEDAYHDHLFSFSRAFELSKHRVELDGSVAVREDFAEKHLTTARFHECVDRWNQFSVDDPNGPFVIVRESLRFACEFGAGDNAANRSARTLLRIAKGLQKPDRTFSGVTHFVSIYPTFARSRGSWVKLFERLEAGDGRGLAQAVREIQKALPK
jgi:tetratricopeptide (TPR) repeat protein